MIVTAFRIFILIEIVLPTVGIIVAVNISETHSMTDTLWELHPITLCGSDCCPVSTEGSGDWRAY